MFRNLKRKLGDQVTALLLRIQLSSLWYKESQLMILNHSFYHSINSCTISV